MAEEASVGWRRDLQASTVDAAPVSPAASAVLVPGLTILCHPDPRRIGEVAALTALPAGRGVDLSRLSPDFASPLDGGTRRPLADAHLSRRPVQLLPGRLAGWLRIEPAPTARHLDLQPAELADVSPEELDEGRPLVLGARVALLLHRVDPTPPRGDDLGLLGMSPAMVELREPLRRLAHSEVPVLVRGETGTGKELVAAAIHRLSRRRPRPYVCVDMAALPPSLAAAELFGAARGAFTGADRAREGYFQSADGGTLFLDEIGDAPAEVQASILRALETGEIATVGTGRPRRVDVRVIAATDADLEARVRDGAFRAPLLYRLEGASLWLPPLRRRRCDIARLLVHFLRRELEICGAPDRLAPAGKGQAPWLPADLMATLVARPWPGNVRQLRNVARQIIVRFRDAPVVAPDAETLQRWGSHGDDAGAPASAFTSATAEGASRSSAAPPGLRQPSQLSAADVAAALEAHRWRILPAARALGISRTSLYALIDRLPGLRRATELDRAAIETAIDATAGDLTEMVSRLRVSRHGLLRRMRELGLP